MSGYWEVPEGLRDALVPIAEGYTQRTDPNNPELIKTYYFEFAVSGTDIYWNPKLRKPESLHYTNRADGYSYAYFFGKVKPQNPEALDIPDKNQQEQ